MMGPLAAVESVVFKYFQVNGRATRAEYWWWALIQFTLLMVLLFSDIRAFTNAQALGLPPSLNPLHYTSLIFILATIIPNFTVTIRRLHDSGRSGFWYLILFAPFVGGIWFFILMLLPSERDDNIYGPPWHDHSRWQGKSEGKANPMQAYAVLDRLHDEPDAAMIAARKAEISEYYRNRVLQGPKD